MKNDIVITGGNSFIARHLLKRIDLCQYRVTAVVRTIPSGEQCISGIRYLEMGMEEYEEMERYITRCDYYFPFAWEGTKRECRNDEKMNKRSYRCILKSIRVMVEKCGCSKVILPGTFSEYRNEHVPIDEDTPCEPEQAYGKYKHQLYQDASRICKEKNVTCVEARLFSVYGADDSDEKVINGILQKMLRNEEISFTKAEQIWDFIHVDDVADAFIKLMETDVESGCYNVTTNEHRTLKSYIEEMKTITGSWSEVKYGEVPYDTETIPHVICKTDKILKAIDWRPQISFSDGVKEMVEYYKNGREIE